MRGIKIIYKPDLKQFKIVSKVKLKKKNFINYNKKLIENNLTLNIKNFNTLLVHNTEILKKNPKKQIYYLNN